VHRLPPEYRVFCIPLEGSHALFFAYRRSLTTDGVSRSIFTVSLPAFCLVLRTYPLAPFDSLSFLPPSFPSAPCGTDRCEDDSSRAQRILPLPICPQRCSLKIKIAIARILLHPLSSSCQTPPLKNLARNLTLVFSCRLRRLVLFLCL